MARLQPRPGWRLPCGAWVAGHVVGRAHSELPHQKGTGMGFLVASAKQACYPTLVQGQEVQPVGCHNTVQAITRGGWLACR